MSYQWIGCGSGPRLCTCWKSDYYPLFVVTRGFIRYLLIDSWKLLGEDLGLLYQAPQDLEPPVATGSPHPRIVVLLVHKTNVTVVTCVKGKYPQHCTQDIGSAPVRPLRPPNTCWCCSVESKQGLYHKWKTSLRSQQYVLLFHGSTNAGPVRVLHSEEEC